MQTITVKLANGKYTITNETTHEHRTFRIATVQKGPLKDRRIVSLLTGPNNLDDYTGFAFLEYDRVSLWQRFRDQKSYQCFARMIETIAAGRPVSVNHEPYSVRVSKHCLRCNHELTDPDSIDALYGPECRGIVQKEGKLAVIAPAQMAA